MWLWKDFRVKTVDTKPELPSRLILPRPFTCQKSRPFLKGYPSNQQGNPPPNVTLLLRHTKMGNTKEKGYYYRRVTLLPCITDLNVSFPSLQVRVVLYENGNEVLFLKFSANGTNRFNWFSQSNLISSPWNDLKGATNLRHFDIIGSHSRSFEISASYGGCDHDFGWLSITAADCSWETRVVKPAPQYSKQTYKTNAKDYGKKIRGFIGSQWFRHVVSQPRKKSSSYHSELIPCELAL